MTSIYKSNQSNYIKQLLTELCKSYLSNLILLNPSSNILAITVDFCIKKIKNSKFLDVNNVNVIESLESYIEKLSVTNRISESIKLKNYFLKYYNLLNNKASVAEKDAHFSIIQLLLSLSSSAPKKRLLSCNILSPRKSSIASKLSIDSNIKLDNNITIINELQDISDNHILKWLDTYENEIDSELDDDENIFEIIEKDEKSNDVKTDNIIENIPEDIKVVIINPKRDNWSEFALNTLPERKSASMGKVYALKVANETLMKHLFCILDGYESQYFPLIDIDTDSKWFTKKYSCIDIETPNYNVLTLRSMMKDILTAATLKYNITAFFELISESAYLSKAYYIFITSTLDLLRELFINRTSTIFELITSLPSSLRTLDLVYLIINDVSKTDLSFPFNDKNYGIAKPHILIDILLKYIQIYKYWEIKHICVAVLRSYLSVISRWITQGKFIDYFQEFIVDSNEIHFSTAMDVYLPNFMKTLSDLITSSGKCVKLALSIHKNSQVTLLIHIWPILPDLTSHLNENEFSDAFNYYFNKLNVEYLPCHFENLIYRSIELSLSNFYFQLNKNLVQYLLSGNFKIDVDENSVLINNSTIDVEDSFGLNINSLNPHFPIYKFSGKISLLRHFSTLRSFFFMESNDVLNTFVSKLFKKFSHGEIDWVKPNVLNAILLDSLNSSLNSDFFIQNSIVSVNIDPPNANKFSLEQDFRLIEADDVGILDWLTFDYALEWPFSLIIDKKCLHKYNSISIFLLQVKRGQSMLESTRFSLSQTERFYQFFLRFFPNNSDAVTALIQGMDASSVMYYHDRDQLLFGPELLSLINSIYAAIHSIFHLISNFYTYIMQRVVMSQWSEFWENIQNSYDINDLIGIHSAYLDTIISNVLLGNSTLMTSLRNTMKIIINLSLKLCSLVKFELFPLLEELSEINSDPEIISFMEENKSIKMKSAYKINFYSTWAKLVKANQKERMREIRKVVYTLRRDFDYRHKFVYSSLSQFLQQKFANNSPLVDIFSRLDYNGYYDAYYKKQKEEIELQQQQTVERNKLDFKNKYLITKDVDFNILRASEIAKSKSLKGYIRNNQ